MGDDTRRRHNPLVEFDAHVLGRRNIWSAWLEGQPAFESGSSPGQMHVCQLQLISFCDGASQTEVVELKPVVQQKETGWFAWIQDLKEYVLWAHRYVSHVITAVPVVCS